MELDIAVSPASNKRKRIIVITVLIVLAVTLVLLTLVPKLPSVKAETLSFVEVQQGPLDIKVPVYGQFQSEFERLVSAPVAGQITDLYIRAGAEVEPNSLIARMSNPDLMQEHFAAQTKLEQMQAEYKLAELKTQNSELAFQAEIAELEYQIKKAELDVAVNTKLLAQGITAKLELEKSELNLSLLKKKFTFSSYRFDKLKEVNRLSLQQKNILLTQQVKLEKLIASKVAALEIKAGISGTLQKVNIKLGEQVTVGQSLAKIGSKHQLIAKVNIPQRTAKNIGLGHKLTIKVNDHRLNAHITQLGSIIENGFIVAEAKITSAIPNSIRPSQPLSGKLFVRHQENALFVKQQPGYKPLSVNFIYKRVEPQLLEKTKVTFGELTDEFLVIEQGGQTGDKFAANDLTKWHDYQKLEIDVNSIF